MMIPPMISAFSIYYLYDPYNTSFANCLEYVSLIMTMHILGSSIGNFFGATFESDESAILVGISTLMVLLTSSGVVKNLQDANWFYQGLSYFTGIRYGIE